MSEKVFILYIDWKLERDRGLEGQALRGEATVTVTCRIDLTSLWQNTSGIKDCRI